MTTATASSAIPTALFTPRLKLRAPVLADASRIATFIGDWEVAKMLSTVPYPYCETDAVTWISGQQPSGVGPYVLVHANGVIGAVSIELQSDGTPELGYWLAKPFWGRGLMTEAAAAVIMVSRAAAPKGIIACSHIVGNDGSKRVIEKLGFTATGERMMRCLARNTEVRLLTYRLPVATLASSPILTSPDQELFSHVP
jgi:[ribosomal protein S5]-alanine N-acetyltransferase